MAIKMPGVYICRGSAYERGHNSDAGMAGNVLAWNGDRQPASLKPLTKCLASTVLVFQLPFQPSWLGANDFFGAGSNSDAAALLMLRVANQLTSLTLRLGGRVFVEAVGSPESPMRPTSIIEREFDPRELRVYLVGVTTGQLGDAVLRNASGNGGGNGNGDDDDDDGSVPDHAPRKRSRRSGSRVTSLFKGAPRLGMLIDLLTPLTTEADRQPPSSSSSLGDIAADMIISDDDDDDGDNLPRGNHQRRHSTEDEEDSPEMRARQRLFEAQNFTPDSLFAGLTVIETVKRQAAATGDVNPRRPIHHMQRLDRYVRFADDGDNDQASFSIPSSVLDSGLIVRIPDEFASPTYDPFWQLVMPYFTSGSPNAGPLNVVCLMNADTDKKNTLIHVAATHIAAIGRIRTMALNDNDDIVVGTEQPRDSLIDIDRDMVQLYNDVLKTIVGCIAPVGVVSVDVDLYAEYQQMLNSAETQAEINVRELIRRLSTRECHSGSVSQVFVETNHRVFHAMRLLKGRQTFTALLLAGMLPGCVTPHDVNQILLTGPPSAGKSHMLAVARRAMPPSIIVEDLDTTPASLYTGQTVAQAGKRTLLVHDKYGRLTVQSEAMIEAPGDKTRGHASNADIPRNTMSTDNAISKTHAHINEQTGFRENIKTTTLGKGALAAASNQAENTLAAPTRSRFIIFNIQAPQRDKRRLFAVSNLTHGGTGHSQNEENVYCAIRQLVTMPLLLAKVESRVLPQTDTASDWFTIVIISVYNATQSKASIRDTQKIATLCRELMRSGAQLYLRRYESVLTEFHRRAAADTWAVDAATAVLSVYMQPETNSRVVNEAFLRWLRDTQLYLDPETNQPVITIQGAQRMVLLQITNVNRDAVLSGMTQNTQFASNWAASEFDHFVQTGVICGVSTSPRSGTTYAINADVIASVFGNNELIVLDTLLAYLSTPAGQAAMMTNAASLTVQTAVNAPKEYFYRIDEKNSMINGDTDLSAPPERQQRHTVAAATDTSRSNVFGTIADQEPPMDTSDTDQSTKTLLSVSKLTSAAWQRAFATVQHATKSFVVNAVGPLAPGRQRPRPATQVMMPPGASKTVALIDKSAMLEYAAQRERYRLRQAAAYDESAPNRTLEQRFKHINFLGTVRQIFVGDLSDSEGFTTGRYITVPEEPSRPCYEDIDNVTMPASCNLLDMREGYNMFSVPISVFFEWPGEIRVTAMLSDYGTFAAYLDRHAFSSHAIELFDRRMLPSVAAWRTTKNSSTPIDPYRTWHIAPVSDLNKTMPIDALILNMALVVAYSGAKRAYKNASWKETLQFVYLVVAELDRRQAYRDTLLRFVAARFDWRDHPMIHASPVRITVFDTIADVLEYDPCSAWARIRAVFALSDQREVAAAAADHDNDNS